MVYGRLLFNNIKQYTPKWFKTIPYSQTTKPTFRRSAQKVGLFNSTHATKMMWKVLRNTFGQYAWSWSLFIFGIGFAWFSSMYYPYLAVYRYNNSERTYAVAYAKQRSFKKRKEEEERLAEEAAGEQGEQQEQSTSSVEHHGESDEAIQNARSHISIESTSHPEGQLSKKEKLEALVNRIIAEQQKKKQNKQKPKSDDEE